MPKTQKRPSNGSRPKVKRQLGEAPFRRWPSIKDGRIDDGLRLMEFDVEMTPGKIWLLRKTSQACLDNGRPEKASAYLKKGLELRPDDEGFETMKAEAEQALKETMQGSLAR